jgi:tRNA pseudouridine55 synthase
MTAHGRSGVLVVDKGPGVTSFDVVALLRRTLGIRRIGHAGTLDPGAVGVLPILVGEATKLMPYVIEHDKEYRALVRLGIVTDTQDLGGRVLSTSPVPPLARQRLEQAVQPFVGRIRQVPPMYSAVHHGGRRLYELARAGVEVARAAREVVVHAIEIETMTETTVTLRIVCGKGTYVRALAADLGASLGCGAAVEQLTRTRVGPFRLADAVAWADVTGAEAARLWERALPPEAVLRGWPLVRLDTRGAHAFVHGQAADVAGLPAETPSRLVMVKDSSDLFLGVGESMAGGRLVKPSRLLHADRPRTDIRPA